MKNIRGFLRRHKLFSVAVIVAMVGAGLQLLDYQTASRWFVSIMTLVIVVPVVYAMIEDIRSGGYGINILAPLAIVIAVFLGHYWAALVVLLVLTGGQALHSYADRRARRELATLQRSAPQFGFTIKNRKTVRVSVSQLRVGDKIIIGPGEVVPVDAVILEGSSSFNASLLTGDTAATTKTSGDNVFGGSINGSESVTAQVIATATDSYVNKQKLIVSGTTGRHAPFARLAARYSLFFTIAALVLATVLWVITGQAVRFLEVIIVASPAALLVATPLAIVAGLSRATKHGIVIKSGSALERLADAESLVFGKAGTLTNGDLAVQTVSAVAPFSKAEVLKLAGSLEQNSDHAVAKAIRAEAAAGNVSVGKAKHVTVVIGRGLQASVKGKLVLVGQAAFLSDNNIGIPAKYSKFSGTQSPVYIAVDGKLAGVITFKDNANTQNDSVFARFKQLGLKHFTLITGDALIAAKAIAKSIGVTAVHGTALPADKLRIIEASTHRPVVYVGHSAQAAPLLTSADVGIALGANKFHGSDEAADVVVLNENLHSVATAYAIAKRSFSVARQIIILGIFLSLILMGLFATGKFTPLEGAGLLAIVEIVSVLGALRARTGKL